MKSPEPSAHADLEQRSLLLLVLAVSSALVWILMPFYGTLLWSAIIALLFAPLHRLLLPRLRHRRTLAALLTVLTAVVMTALSVGFEQPQWKAPSTTTWGAILFNAVGVFGFAHAAWFYLARALPPVASTLSVMLIPIIGVFSGALWLGELLHWQDFAAVGLMVVAIASVLWPANHKVS